MFMSFQIRGKSARRISAVLYDRFTDLSTLIVEVVVGCQFHDISEIGLHQIHMQICIHITKIHRIIYRPLRNAHPRHRHRCLLVPHRKVTTGLRVAEPLFTNGNALELLAWLVEEERGVQFGFGDEVVDQDQEFDADGGGVTVVQHVDYFCVVATALFGAEVEQGGLLFADDVETDAFGGLAGYAGLV